MKLARNDWQNIVASALFAYAVLLIATALWGARYVEVFAPLYRWQIQNMLPDYQVDAVRVVKQMDGLDRVEINVMRTRTEIVAGRVLYPGESVQCSTLLGYPLQHVIVMGTLLFAWPGFRGVKRLGLPVLMIPMLVAVELIDVPVMLAGNVTAAIMESVNPQRYQFHPLILWIDSLDAGGRVALSIAAALCVVGLARAMERATLRHAHSASVGIRYRKL